MFKMKGSASRLKYKTSLLIFIFEALSASLEGVFQSVTQVKAEIPVINSV